MTDLRVQRRLQVISWVGRAAFAALLLGLVHLQIIRGGELRHLARRNAVRLIPIAAPRGDILDRDGHPLATNRLSFDVAVIPQDAPAVEFVLGRMAELLQEPVTELRKRYTRNRSFPFAPSVIVPDAPLEVVATMEEHRHELPGVVVLPRSKRDYPHGRLAAHVLGYIGPIGAQELARRREYGYHMRDQVGKSGVEAIYDAYLRGTDGGVVVEVDHRGHQVRVISRREPVPGQSLTLTLDAALQQAVEEHMADRAGACVVLAPRTGEVLALASVPAFAPSAFLASARGEATALLKDARQPLLNRAIRGVYPPGSIFKLVTGAAAVETRALTPISTFLCEGSLRVGGRAFPCWKRDGHGTEYLRRALAHSCNVYFFHAGLGAGIDRLVHWAQRFGIGQLTEIDLPGEQAGLLPNRAWKQRLLRESWYDGDTANLSIGQGSLLLTPVQAARMIAVVANGGWLVRPHVVRAIGGVQVPVATAHATGIAPATRQALLEGLIDVVAAPDGTGHRTWKPGLSIAGKTGTAQTGRPGVSHAWMIGMTPIEQPTAAFAMVFEFGGSGGLWPALLAQRIAEVLAVREQPPPAPVVPRDAS